MLMRVLLVVAIAFANWCPATAQTPSNTNPPVGTQFTNCIEGRALRIVNGIPSCSTTNVPTLTSCGTGTIDSTATDFTGVVVLPTGISACTIVFTKLYNANFFCVAQSQGATLLSIGSTTTDNTTGPTSTLKVPLTANLSATRFGYICAPG